ncbi:MAG: transcriptional repressor LexA [Chloroflexi bacterium]|nr:transcriptional repressor LexA [Chloroflexota bacterium]
MKKKLSARQERILSFIRNFMEERQYPPTVRDIQAGCDISSTSVVDYNLQILQREGFLKREPEVSRGIELLDGYRSTRRNIVRVPVLGNIAAGEPLSIPSPDALRSDEFENLDLPAFLTKGKENVFALRVKGMSMIDAYIYDGDLVLLEPESSPENGAMVAAWLNDRDETTLKRFYIEGDTVRLQPENESLEPIVLPADKVSVKGKVVGVIRTV